MNYLTYQTELSGNIVAFCRYMRGKGLTIGPADQADALRALEIIPFGDPENFRLTLRAVLTRDLNGQNLFDKYYQDYWDQLTRAVDAKIKDGESSHSFPDKSVPDKQNKPAITSLQNWLYGNKSQDEEELATYSPIEVLTQKDFSGFSDEQVREAMKLITIIAKSLATRYSRRYKRNLTKGAFDFRQTMRRNLRQGGEILEIAFRRRRRRKLKMIMLCDVSKSMDLYSRFLIQFIYAFQTVYKHIETFVFSTNLHQITGDMQNGNYTQILQQLSYDIPDWSGGTKIGASLKSFVDNFGKRLLDNRTVVLIMSDGWDTGDIDLLEENMRQIHRQSAKVIWLNPLAGSPKYEPTARGMQTAMPYIDVFAPAHNIESLKAIVKHLGSGRNRNIKRD